MHPDLRPVVDSMERQTEELIQRARSLPDTKVGDSWTPTETIRHLLLVETYSSAEILAPGQEVGKKANSMIVRMLAWTMRKGIRLPAPSAMEPQGDEPLDVVIAQWRHLRSAVVARLESAQPDEYVTRHPIFGAMTAKQVVEVTDAHLGYHLMHPPFGSKS